MLKNILLALIVIVVSVGELRADDQEKAAQLLMRAHNLRQQGEHSLALADYFKLIEKYPEELITSNEKKDLSEAVRIIVQKEIISWLETLTRQKDFNTLKNIERAVSVELKRDVEDVFRWASSFYELSKLVTKVLPWSQMQAGSKWVSKLSQRLFEMGELALAYDLLGMKSSYSHTSLKYSMSSQKEGEYQSYYLEIEFPEGQKSRKKLEGVGIYFNPILKLGEEEKKTDLWVLDIISESFVNVLVLDAFGNVKSKERKPAREVLIVLTIDDVFSESEFASIKAGTFQMGSPPAENGRTSDEKQTWVKLTHDFEMQVHEVTQLQYEYVMGENPSNFKGLNLPVEMVSWFDAVKFANQLSELKGLKPCYKIIENKGEHSSNITVELNEVSNIYECEGYRLPTEAEWEYAARAGTTTPYSFEGGEVELEKYGWYFKNSNGRTHSVGELPANKWGLKNMHGNVWEWCHDWYSDYEITVDEAHPIENPQGSNADEYHVLRGGGWGDYAQYLRSAYRSFYKSGVRTNSLGFRLVRSK
ncbi:MAG: formylglycine-generating enzyme family protein [Deltaproteobacteria bacterium]|nr:formylglycine-generating enzyme family protein [Deltaproteobacteria bacterium]